MRGWRPWRFGMGQPSLQIVGISKWSRFEDRRSSPKPLAKGERFTSAEVWKLTTPPVESLHFKKCLYPSSDTWQETRPCHSKCRLPGAFMEYSESPRMEIWRFGYWRM